MEAAKDPGYVLLEVPVEDRAQMGRNLREMALQLVEGKDDPRSQLAMHEHRLGLGVTGDVGLSDLMIQAVLPNFREAAGEQGSLLGTSELRQLFFGTSSTTRLTLETACKVFGTNPEALTKSREVAA